MKANLWLGMALTAISTTVFAQQSEVELAVDDFECVAEIADGDFRARFSTHFPLLTEEGRLHYPAGTLVSRHSEILDTYSYQSSADNLRQVIDHETRFITTHDVPEMYATIVRTQNQEFEEGIKAIEESKELGAATPACEIYLGS